MKQLSTQKYLGFPKIEESMNYEKKSSPNQTNNESIEQLKKWNMQSRFERAVEIRDKTVKI